MEDLSKEKGPEHFPPWAFIRFILHSKGSKAAKGLGDFLQTE